MILLRRSLPGLTLLALTIASIAPVLRAELPQIRFNQLQTLGANAGGEVEATVQGNDTEGVEALRFDHPGLTAEFLKERQFKIKVAADVPEGTYDVRLVGRFGISNPRQFAVSHGLTDVAEKEPNNMPEEAQKVSLNSGINGICDGNGQDAFQFTMKQGERITIDCQASRLDSELDANLILSSAAGQILANNGDYHGRDPFIDFIAPADGDYIVIVHDLSYRGGQPYRLVISTRPQIENIFPRAVTAGQSVELTAYGRNLTNHGGAKSDILLNTLPLDTFKFSLTPQTELAAGRTYTFLEHPTDHSVLPTAATCTLDGFQVRVPIAGGALHPQSLMVTSQPVVLDREPNNEQTQAQPLTLPAVVAGRFDQPQDADWYSIEIPTSGNYYFDVYSERIAGRADPYVNVIDDKGNQVGELDDFGHRMNAFDGHLRDPAGAISLQEKRTYRVLVQDRYSRGGPRYQYVLSIRPPQSDIYVAAIHSANPGPGGTNLWKGGAEFLDVVIHQQDGFNAPVTVTAEDLPPGLHAAPTVINNNSRGTFVLWSDPGAADWQGNIRLIARAEVDGKPLTRQVRPYTRVWNGGPGGSSRPMRDITVSLKNSAPYSLRIEPEKLTVKSGEKANCKLIVTRHWPEFTGAVTIIPLGFPGNFNFGTQTINENQTEIPLSIDVQNGTRPGDYTLTVLGQAQVPFNKDPQAKERPKTLVSTPSRPVTITVAMPEKK